MIYTYCLFPHELQAVSAKCVCVCVHVCKCVCVCVQNYMKYTYRWSPHELPAVSDVQEQPPRTIYNVCVRESISVCVCVCVCVRARVRTRERMCARQVLCKKKMRKIQTSTKAAPESRIGNIVSCEKHSKRNQSHQHIFCTLY